MDSRGGCVNPRQNPRNRFVDGRTDSQKHTGGWTFAAGRFAQVFVPMKIACFSVWFVLCAVTLGAEPPGAIDLASIPSPVLFRGDAGTAYRDPAAMYQDGWFRVFMTVVKTDADKRVFSTVAWSKSRDLIHWTEPKIFTPLDPRLNYGSVGDIVRGGDEWVLCLQTYPRPNGEKYGNADWRIWTMRSRDLETWGPAELLRVKGPDVPDSAMGRMIDPYLLESKDEPGKWWCFFKQNGLGMAWSRDLRNWTFAGHVSAGENPCIIVDRDE